jgi:uncharacterized protein
MISVSAPDLPPLRPRVWTVFVAYALSQVVDVMAAGAVVVVLACTVHGGPFESAGEFWKALAAAGESVRGTLGIIVSTMLVFTAAAAGGALLSPVPWRNRLRLQAARLTRWGWVVSVCGIISIGLIVTSLDGLSLLPKSAVWEDLEAFIRGLSGLGFLATALVMGVMPGIAEELLFRGYIQTRLSERWGARRGILWTALMFGVMHLDPVQGLFAMIMGIYLGYLTEKTGSILPAILCHAANNTFAVSMDYLAVEIVGRWPNVVALVVGVVVLWTCLRYLRRPQVPPLPR